MTTVFDPGKFVEKAPKPLPVLLLLDVSTSMEDNMPTLNAAVREMLTSFAEEEKMETCIQVAVITYSNDASVIHEFTPASSLLPRWTDLAAGGMTALGAALKAAKQMIEDKQRTPSDAYRPTVVLVSDGMPNDDWQGPLADFISRGRTAKCDRMSMAIGRSVDEAMLKSFLSGENQLQYADNAQDIKKFFKRVTMSTLMRTRSVDANQVPAFDDVDLDS